MASIAVTKSLSLMLRVVAKLLFIPGFGFSNKKNS